MSHNIFILGVILKSERTEKEVSRTEKHYIFGTIIIVIYSAAKL